MESGKASFTMSRKREHCRMDPPSNRTPDEPRGNSFAAWIPPAWMV